MTFLSSFRLHTILLTALLAAFGGCSTLKPVEDQSHFLLLEERPTKATLPDRSAWTAPVRLLRIQIAGYLSRPEVILHEAPGVVRVKTDQRWAEPLDLSVERVLGANLQARIPVMTLAGMSQTGTTRSTELQVLIHFFGISPDGRTRLAGQVGMQHHGRPQLVESFDLSLPSAKQPTSGPEMANQMSNLLGQLADWISLQLVSPQP